MRAARWRGFRRYLKSSLGEQSLRDAAFASRDLAVALALGLGPQSSRYLKRHPGALPPWFAGVGDTHDRNVAFAAFVGSTAHGGGGGAGVGAGGAAGGGASGAG